MAKKLLGIVGGTLVGLVVLFFVVGLFLPKEFTVERSTTIEAPVDIVFNHVADLTQNEAWMPWNKDDPTMKITWGDETRGQGASFSWTSEKQGNGSLTTVAYVENESLVNDIQFGRGGPGKGMWTFAAAGDTTQVTWGMVGEAANVPQRWFGLMADSMAGPMFELGLANLKKIAEEEAASIESGDVEEGEMAAGDGAME